tara:strand:+ start:5585 stop:6223 length:639 start_codon:yes stop_codon:yes gene_type:complete
MHNLLNMFFEISPYHIDKRLIKETVNVMKKGGIVIFPTDSVYAVGCDLHHKKALQKLSKFKGEKLHQMKISIICKDLSQVSEYTKQMSRSNFKILKHHLPGPFTFILKADQIVPKMFDTNKKEIGVRITENSIIQNIVEELGNPVATCSLHDDDEPILEYFVNPYAIFEKYEQEVSIIIDGGQGKIEPSTVVNCLDDNHIQLIRQGGGILNL